MKIVRFQYQQSVRYGVLEREDIFALQGDILSDINVGEKICNLKDVKILAPVQPGLVVGLGETTTAFWLWIPASIPNRRLF